MQPKILLATAWLASPLVAADGPRLFAREAEALPATSFPATRTAPPGVEPSKFSKFQADMSSYKASAMQDPVYTSMRNVLKTAIPQSYKDAVRTNPASVHKQFETATPDWYKKLPDNVKKFMDKNQKAAKSIWEKDIGPVPTGSNGSGNKGTAAKQTENGKKSEAHGVSLVGATVCAVVGAFGVAALML